MLFLYFLIGNKFHEKAKSEKELIVLTVSTCVAKTWYCGSFLCATELHCCLEETSMHHAVALAAPNAQCPTNA